MNEQEQKELTDHIKYKRGEVAISFAFIENLIAKIISEHYLNKKDDIFINEVLEDEYFNFGLLVKIFEKILKKDPNLEKAFPLGKLKRLQQLRNIITHSRIEAIATKEMSTTKLLTIDKIIFVHGGNDLEFQTLFDEYFLLKEEVQLSLGRFPGVKIEQLNF